MALKLGTKAPAFSAYNQAEDKVALKDNLGQWVVLYFYPKDMTPGCTTEANDFKTYKSKFKQLGAQIIGVSKDSVTLHQKFVEKHQLNFDLLADEEGKICEKYGVWQEKSLYGKKFWGIVRTTCLIDPKGILVKVYPKVKVKDHAKTVWEDLKQLQKSS